MVFGDSRSDFLNINYIFKTIAIDIAKRIANKHDFIIDGFGGCGGNIIQFSKYMKKVFAIELFQERIDMAKHNAKIYNVGNNIEFLHGDFFEKIKLFHDFDSIFLSPPWGGINYHENKIYPFNRLIYNRGMEMISLCFSITKNICLLLPKNIDIIDLLTISQIFDTSVEIEYIYKGNVHFVTIAYFGDF